MVDASSPVPVLQAAIDSAGEGDTILLLPGESEKGQTITIAGKSLNLVDPLGAPMLRLVVRDVPAGGLVMLSGVRIQRPASQVGAISFTDHHGALDVIGCEGAVWADRVLAEGADVFATTFFGIVMPPYHGVVARDSSLLVLADCSVGGGKGAAEVPSCSIGGYAPAGKGGAGILSAGSTVLVHGGTATGGPGGWGSGGACGTSTGAEGGSGLRVYDSRLHLAGGAFHGGSSTPGKPNARGPGLVVDDATSLVTRRGALIAAGEGTGSAPDLSAPPGTVLEYDSPPRHLEIATPLHEGETGLLNVHGESGDVAVLFASVSVAALDQPGKQGFFLTGAPLAGAFLLGAHPGPDGPWGVPFRAPVLPAAGPDALSVLLQLLVHDGRALHDEGAAALVVLDASLP